jgi:hypothetical protein
MSETLERKFAFVFMGDKVMYSTINIIKRTKVTIKLTPADKPMVITYLHQLFLPVFALSKKVISDMIFTPLIPIQNNIRFKSLTSRF